MPTRSRRRHAVPDGPLLSARRTRQEEARGRAREALVAEARFLGEPLAIAPGRGAARLRGVGRRRARLLAQPRGEIEDGDELGDDALTLARLTADSLDRVGRLARAALDSRATAAVGADIEMMGDLVAQALEAAFRGLDLTPEQRARAVERAVARITELEDDSPPIATFAHGGSRTDHNGWRPPGITTTAVDPLPPAVRLHFRALAGDGFLPPTSLSLEGLDALHKRRDAAVKRLRSARAELATARAAFEREDERGAQARRPRR